MAERDLAETEATGSRTTNDSKVDQEYARTRQELVEKYVRLDREARSSDEQKRRAIVDAAMAGESKAKSEFASASRRISGDFDAVREKAKADHSRAKSEAATRLEAGTRKAAGEHHEALKPLKDAAGIADSFRNRLATLAADYRKFQLSPDPPAPVRETYSKFAEPVDELFNRLGKIEPVLKILEGLHHPQVDEGGTGSLDVYPGRPPGRRAGPGDGTRADRLRGLGHHRTGGWCAVANLACPTVQDPARATLQAAHAIAGRRRWPERLLSNPGDLSA